MKIIDDKMIEAFRAARVAYPSMRAMSHVFGMSAAMMSRVLKGKVSHIKDVNWKRVMPILKPYYQDCPKGLDHCPYDGCHEFKVLVNRLSEINDPKIFLALEKDLDRLLKTR